LLGGESLRERGGLFTSRFVERDVALTLKALVKVPVGLSVADEKKFHGLNQQEWT